MENKNVGILIIGIAVVLAIIVLMFNAVLMDITDATCSHGDSCEMYSSIKTQTGISLAIVGVIIIIGLVIMFMKPKEKIIIKKIKDKKKRIKLEGLEKSEKKVVELLKKEGNAIFQAELMEKLEIGKVKTTRMLDKLESKGIIERKRRGMNNIVVLKD
ncbi:MAG: MarR family transcriptional regulator [archaeon]